MIGIRKWQDFNSKEVLGSIVDTVIWEDKTSYIQKDGSITTNAFEKLPIKVSKEVTVPIDSFVTPINAIATVYGNYRNELSVKAEDIKVLPTNQSTASNQEVQPKLVKQTR